MSTTAARMGVEGGAGYGKRVDRALASIDLSRDEMLSLAWALVDQASNLRTTRLAQTALTAIEDLYDAEEHACPACETTLCACADCGAPCTKECNADCSSRSIA